MTQSPNVGVDAASPEAESEGIDLDQFREMAGFVLRATRRRATLAMATFVTIAALGLTVSATMPRTYSAEIKLLAQRGSAIRMLSSSNPYNMENVDNPTKNVGAMITRRDNLVALAKEADLVRRFDETRPAAMRLKDHVFAALFGPMSAEDKQKAMTFTLERNLTVTVSPDDATVVINVDWSNPGIAYDLVTLVQKNFLEARYDSDIGMVNESIGVLEEHAKNELAHVDAELDAYQKIVVAKAAGPANAAMAAGRASGQPAPRFYATGSPVDPELVRALDGKRIQIRALEEAQQRALEAVRQQLAQAQLTLTPMHPTVIALQQRFDSLGQPAPDLLQARSEEHALMAQIAAKSSASSSGSQSTGAPSRSDTLIAPSAPTPAVPVVPMSLDRDGQVLLAQSNLGAAIRAYEEAMARIDQAKVELDITRTAFKHRYTVVTPAERPKKPKKPTAQLVGVASVVGGALLALFLAAAADLATGAILETWQVRRRLKIDLLADLDMPWS